ncbi:MAG TPA: hypothetical protein VHP12_08170, partial [Chitinophagaceae bacterium]|nr:hypothetical protein [Chitinophagaceae bacterium]
EELDEFRKENYRVNHSLSATLKKLYCEQHYKKAKEERKTEQFKLKSINRFYLYFSGKHRNDFWKEKGATEINKILCAIQSEIDAFQQKKSIITEPAEQDADEKEQLLQKGLHHMPDREKYHNEIVPHLPETVKKALLFYRMAFIASALIVFGFLVYYSTILQPRINDAQQTISAFQKKITRTPAKAGEVPGLIGTWYSYNRTPEANDENRRKGAIFRGIEWKINSDKNGNLVFSRPTSINENEGWIELINMQINFFMNVHPKFGDKNSEQNFGFRHFICKPNKVDLNKADTLWCVCTSFVHKDGRLDDPLASREIMIRKKEGQVYPSDLIFADSMPEALKILLPQEKSYLKLKP